MTIAAIFGLHGPVLLDSEAEFLAAHPPFGIILFGRNCETAEQIEQLTAAAREAAGTDLHLLIDQEGGRVQRLKPPLWRQAPPARKFGILYNKNPEAGQEAAFLNAYLIARDLAALGFTIDCAPCLDVATEATHQAIGDRAYAMDADIVTAAGGAAVAGFRAGGIWPVIKHLPGHGRTVVDSHYATPVVTDEIGTLRNVDWKPFRALADLPFAMTSHIIFPSLDPTYPATQSRLVIENVIRGEIGFKGLLMTDDLCMQALSGSAAERAQRAWDAGVDVAMHCNGKLDEMQAIAEIAPELNAEAWHESPCLTGHAYDQVSTQRLAERLDSIMQGVDN